MIISTQQYSTFYLFRVQLTIYTRNVAIETHLSISIDW